MTFVRLTHLVRVAAILDTHAGSCYLAIPRICGLSCHFFSEAGYKLAVDDTKASAHCHNTL